MFRLRAFIWKTTALLIATVTLLNATSTPTMQVLRTFENATDEPKWVPQNDGVMGGVSLGTVEIVDGHLHFYGKLSLENNGGFAQIYSPTERSDFSAFAGIKLRVKGDGRTYQFRFETDARLRWGRVAYRADFQTEPDQWIDVEVPFSSFSPSFRGRLLSGPPLDLTSIRQIALLLGDGRPGPFSLQVAWIGLE